jgi:hypothetical protein
MSESVQNSDVSYTPKSNVRLYWHWLLKWFANNISAENVNPSIESFRPGNRPDNELACSQNLLSLE